MYHIHYSVPDSQTVEISNTQSQLLGSAEDRRFPETPPLSSREGRRHAMKSIRIIQPEIGAQLNCRCRLTTAGEAGRAAS